MFKKLSLKSGLRIITTPMDNTKAVTVLVLVGTGSRNETKNINGVSHFLEHLFFKGTKKRPTALSITKELDRIGSLHNAFTSKELTGFWIKVGSQHLDLALNILSDILFHSLFQKEEIEKERKVIFEEINMYYDIPQRYVGELFEELLYDDQSLAWNILGSKETLAKIQRDNIMDYFRRQYTAENIIISVAGNLKEKETIAQVKRYFNKFKKKIPRNIEKICELQRNPRALVHFKETDQTHFSLGVRSFGLFDARKYPLALMSVVLGGIMSSRLFVALREKRGLCYRVRSMPEHFVDCGYLVTTAGVDNKKTEEAIKIILREYKKLSQKRISKEELLRAKDNVKGHLYLSLETSDAWASYTAAQEILEGKISTPEEECAKINKVTADDILKTAQEIFKPENLNLALIGPFKDRERFEKLLKF